MFHGFGRVSRARSHQSPWRPPGQHRRASSGWHRPPQTRGDASPQPRQDRDQVEPQVSARSGRPGDRQGCPWSEEEGPQALVNRKEGGAETIRDAGLPFVALSTRSDYVD